MVAKRTDQIVYLVSRYEEYLPFVKDIHQRFQAENSLAFKQGFLQKPVVNIWAKTLMEKISYKYPDFKVLTPTYQFISTIDIDNAFYFQEKGFVRSVAGILNSLIRFNFEEVSERIKVIFE